MRFHYVFKCDKPAATVIDYSEKKLDDTLNKYIRQPLLVHVVTRSDDYNLQVKCNLHSHAGFNVSVQGEGPTYTDAIDSIVDKLKTQLQKKKTKWLSYNRAVNSKYQSTILPGWDAVLEEADNSTSDFNEFNNSLNRSSPSSNLTASSNSAAN